MAAEYKIVTRITSDGVRTGRREVERELTAMEAAAERTKATLIRTFGAAALGGALVGSVKKATEFEGAIAEIATLVDETQFDMDALTKSTLEQAAAFGSLPAEQAAAQYQIISAGASSAAEATEILTAANKLAVGGVTDVATASDGLTSVLNAYGSRVEGATAVSDAMFVAMRAGKTTIGELSGSLGKVAPLAASTGVSFDELVGSIAALTKGGISTTESVTGVRAILAAVAKPTKEASEMAAQLGLNFSSAAIEAQGFQQFIEDIVTKTGGSNDALSQLFGGVEALVPAMALAGTAGEDFNAIMASMEGKAGSTNAAYEKVAKTVGQQWNEVVAKGTVLMIEAGTALFSVLGPALAFVNENFDLMVSIAGAAVTGFIAYRGAVLLAAAANVVMSGSSGVMIATIATVTRQFGLAAGAQVLFAGSTAAAGVAVRAFTAAIIASPLAPLAIALTAAGAAYLYFTSSTDDATAATLSKVEADRIAMEAEAARIKLVQELVQATEAERQQMIAAARASIQKAQASVVAAQADIQAAKAALDRAVAERELAAAISAKNDSGIDGKFGRLGVSVVGGGAVSSAQADLDARKKATAQAEAILEQKRLDLKALRDNLSTSGNVPAFNPSVGAVDSGSSSRGRAANDNAPSTTFKDVETDLNRELELIKLIGIEREIRQEQLSAEDRISRKLSATEKELIADRIREIDEIDRWNQAQEQVIGSLIDEQEILGLTGVARDVRAAQLRAEEILDRELYETEAKLIENLVKENDELARQSGILNEINGPVERYKEQIASLVTLLERGAISQADFNVAVNELGVSRDFNNLLLSLEGTAEQREAELEQERRFTDEKLQIVQRAEQAQIITEQRAANLRVQIAADEARRIRAIKTAQRSADLQNAQSVFDSLTGITKDFAGEQSAIYKAMFTVSKAFAIADSIVKIQQAMANALSQPFPANLAAIATVAAQAASIVSNIKAVTMGFESGGYTGSGGRQDIAGVVHGQEFVIDADKTRQHRPLLEAIHHGRALPSTGGGSSSGSGNGPAVHIENLVIQSEAKGDSPEQDAQTMAEEFKRSVSEITREELADQGRAGGALTQSKKSVMAGG